MIPEWPQNHSKIIQKSSKNEAYKPQKYESFGSKFPSDNASKNQSKFQGLIDTGWSINVCHEFFYLTSNNLLIFFLKKFCFLVSDTWSTAKAITLLDSFASK